MMNTPRTRFAPSPTGRMHVGNLRTALYAYLLTKHEGGDFILRIEDTDQERYVEGAVEAIYRALDQTGLVYDEGPDKDGGVGPYIQSERMASGLYMHYAKELVEKGEAYYCFCTPERLASLKGPAGDGEFAAYDKHCLSLTAEEVADNLAQNKPYVIRLNIPDEGETTFHDEIYGDISVPNEELDDMILIKSDGYPTYNFANVVDDHLQGITHVVRGNEYLSSSPKYNRLYAAFGWDVPVYVHCPLITDENHQKLSKRSGHASYEELLDQGFMPEAVLNYVALLGWSPVDNREMFTLEELVEAFDYRHINKSPAVFDIEKLKWLNGEYFKAMDDEKFYLLAEPYLEKAVSGDYDRHVLADMVKTRIQTFPDIREQLDFIDKLPEYSTDLYTHKKMKSDPARSLSVLQDLLPVLEEQQDYSNDALFELLKGYAAEHELKNGTVMWPVRVALSGKMSTPGGATQLLELFGKQESINRINDGIRRLQAGQTG